MNEQREIDQVQKKILKIEALLAEVKSDLYKVAESKADAPYSKKEALPSVTELRDEFDSLFELFLVRKIAEIRDRLLSHSKSYLNAFCSANELPIDSKRLAKQDVVESILQWFAQRKAISQRVK